MTFQVSDVQITSCKMRRLATLYGLLSFLFVIALSVNLAAAWFEAPLGGLWDAFGAFQRPMGKQSQRVRIQHACNGVTCFTQHCAKRAFPQVYAVGARAESGLAGTWCQRQRTVDNPNNFADCDLFCRACQPVPAIAPTPAFQYTVIAQLHENGLQKLAWNVFSGCNLRD
jgi:hypothetical protein